MVAGKGIERLLSAGVDVVVGVLEEECRAHHKRFFTVQEKKRPFIILKWAETQNGFIAPKTKQNQEPVWISNQYSQQIVHRLRSKEHAILVGTNTVITDNPKLNVRSWSGAHPIRIILDKTLRIPDTYHVFDEGVKTIILVDLEYKSAKKNTKNLFFEPIDFSKRIAQQICEVLQKHQIQSLIIEGGTQTLQTFIDENLWDEAMVFIGKSSFQDGVKAPVLQASFREKNIKDDVLKIYTND